MFSAVVAAGSWHFYELTTVIVSGDIILTLGRITVRVCPAALMSLNCKKSVI